MRLAPARAAHAASAISFFAGAKADIAFDIELVLDADSTYPGAQLDLAFTADPHGQLINLVAPFEDANVRIAGYPLPGEYGMAADITFLNLNQQYGSLHLLYFDHKGESFAIDLATTAVDSIADIRGARFLGCSEARESAQSHRPNERARGPRFQSQTFDSR